MAEGLQVKPDKKKSSVRRNAVLGGLLLAVFLLGFIPMWFKLHDCNNRLSDVERALDLSRIENTIASAAIHASRGDYEPARQAASRFFSSVSAEIDRGAESIYTQPQKAALQPLFSRRDDLITLLARSDPASAGRLTDLYLSYLKILSS